MADSTNRAVRGTVIEAGVQAVDRAVVRPVDRAVYEPVYWGVWRAGDWAGGRAATRIVRGVVVDAAPRANHPALQDFLKGVELQ